MPDAAEADVDDTADVLLDAADDEQHDRVYAGLLAELGEAEFEPEFDDEERDDADHAQVRARYLRRQKDRELYEQLAAAGFRGTKYEIFRGELVAYALPVLRSWLRRGLIFTYTYQQGRPLKVTDYDRVGLDDVDERIGLCHETAARALTLFHKQAEAGTGWSHDGGAALTTYFIGACVAVFPGVFRQWQRGRNRWNKAVDTGMRKIDPGGLNPRDPAEEVVSREKVIDSLRRMPATVRDIASRVVWEDHSHAEIAAELGLTERSVEGHLYRYRTEYQRRHGGGRDE